jgi:predicted transcriptional regulator
MYQIAQAVGLWLAEGDKTTTKEITFTNNEPSLISFFHRVVHSVVQPVLAPRVYVYLPKLGSSYSRPVQEARYRVYVDKRANFPYYIYRISGVKSTRKWKTIVSRICLEESNYEPILQGFFAGEGNIKAGLRDSRAVRIAQGKRNRLVERILRHFSISFDYGGHRMYTISGRANLDKFLEHRITVLHPIKHRRFLEMMASFRQLHYAKGALRRTVLSDLHDPMTTSHLARLAGRTTSRLRKVLRVLKGEGLVRMFHVNSVCYWVRADANVILISRQKMKILGLLKVKRRVFEMAQVLRRDDRSISRRLHELESLGLVDFQKPFWNRKGTSCRVISR